MQLVDSLPSVPSHESSDILLNPSAEKKKEKIT